MPIASFDAFINNATGGGAVAAEHVHAWKIGRVGAAAAAAPIAGKWVSLWQYVGQGMCGGSMPGGTFRNPVGTSGSTTVGALPITDATGGRTKYLTGLRVSCNTIGSLYLVDRLADISGFSGTSTSAQATTSLAVTRYTGAAAAGNLPIAELGTQIGASATTTATNYTDESGNTNNTGQSVPIGATGLREAQRVIFLPTATSDQGVRSVETFTNAATTGTVGDICIAIIRPLLMLNFMQIGVGGGTDLLQGGSGPIEIKAGAALTFLWNGQGTTIPEINAHFVFQEH